MGGIVGQSLRMKSSVSPPFVTVEGRRFVLDSKPWHVRGTNLWYGASLGRPSNPTGRARLVRELDRLEELGINNLRVLGGSEDCAVACTLKPAITIRPGEYDEDMLEGLDFLISEAGKRRMNLVVFLNNFWDWSGGIPQYLAWATGNPAKGLADLPWAEWNRLQSSFYTNDAAQELYRGYLGMILGRTSSVTGIPYRDDPAILAWELANEPRPGAREEDNPGVFAAFLRWVDSTASFIHSLDRRHLVTTGSEGSQGTLESLEYFRQVHALPSIDYAVFHLWPKNWGWFKVDRHAETLPASLENAEAYFRDHIAVAEALGKPIVLEEFGLDRDGGTTPAHPVGCRDRLYGMLLGRIEESIARGGSAAGSNFWLWGGEGRPPAAGEPPPNDGIGAGDMLQEAPGLNAVLDCDSTTLAVLSAHYAKLK
jgi:mannan endo-1,4-beta-mannosidase